MKKLILMVTVCAAALGAIRAEETSGTVEGYPWTTEVHPDWDSVLQSATDFVIPADTAYIIDGEADMTKLNDWIGTFASPWGNINFGNANSALILDNTTTWFRNGSALAFVRGYLVKRGASTLANGPSSASNFKGDWIVEGGIFKEAGHYWNDPRNGSKIVVKAGGTFQKSFSCPGGTTEILLEGTGSEGQGALVVDTCNGNGMLPRVTLTGDALISVNPSGTFFDRFIPGTSPGDYEVAFDPAELKLNGHKLTLGGTAAQIGFRKVDVTSDGGVGTIELAALAGGGARTLQLREGANLGADVCVNTKDDATVLFDGATGIAQAAAITAEGNLTFAASSAQGASDAVWAGAVRIAADKAVTVNPDGDNRTVTIAGVISGEGGLQVGASGAATSGSVRLLAENAYAGGTLVNIAGNVFLGSAKSIPDLDEMTLTAGALYAAPTSVGDGTATWDADGVLALARKSGSEKVVVDTTGLARAFDLTIASSDVARFFPQYGLTWDARGTGAGYLLTGPYTEDHPLNLDVRSGVVRVGGDEQIVLGTASVGGNSAADSGTLVLDGARDVVFSDQTFSVGAPAYEEANGQVARLVVTNSTLRSEFEFTQSEIYQGSLFVGNHETGILTVEAGSVVSNRLMVGGGYSASWGTGVGAVYQRGGLVAPRCNESLNDAYNSNIGNCNHGSYELSGGVFRPTGRFTFATYGSAVFLQTGGFAEFPNGCYHLAWDNTGRETYTVLGGTTKVVNAWRFICGIGGRAAQTVQGEDAHIDCSQATYGGILHCCLNAYDDRLAFNVNDGGVFTLGGFYMYETSYPYEYPLIVNFNGGCIRNCGYTHVFGANGSQHPAKVVVYERGAEFATDTEDRAFDNLNGVLTVEKAGGIQSVALPAEGLPGFHSIPYVDIAGDGHGASATALVDSRTSTVTNILVTGHGWGYDPATTVITLKYNGAVKYTVPAADVTIADNDVGGLTMKGPGTFNLQYENAWEKWTKVLGGTLRATCDWAIPSNTVLTVSNGATLDLGGKLATFAGLAGNGGTVANGAAVMEDGMTVSARKLITRETTAIAGALDLSGVKRLVLTETDCLDEAAKQLRGVNLFTATDLVLPAGGVEVVGLPEGFHATWRPNGLWLAPDRGSVILLR